MSVSRRFIPVCLAALLLAGCAGGGMQLGGAGSAGRPKTILVSDFVFSGEVVAVDRGFTTRLERKVGQFPTHERKQRTLERVNDEIVATIIASLREAGFDAQPGNEEGLSLSDDALIVSGRLRGGDPASAAAKNNKIGFGAGYGGVAAEMSLSHFSSSGKRQLTSFTAEPAGGRVAANPKLAAANNAAIAAALGAQNSAKEKLSPDVEAQARRLGRAAGEKILAYAKEQGWMAKPEGGEVVEAAPPPEPKPPRGAPVRAQKKQAAPPPDQDEPDKN